MIPGRFSLLTLLTIVVVGCATRTTRTWRIEVPYRAPVVIDLSERNSPSHPFGEFEREARVTQTEQCTVVYVRAVQTKTTWQNVLGGLWDAAKFAGAFALGRGLSPAP